MKPIGYHREAEEELEEAAKHLEQQRDGLGLEFQAEIERATRRIQRNPRQCGQYKDTDFRKYVVQTFRYTIFYRELDDRIWIAAVAHQSRRPDYWMHRTPE